MLHRKTILLLAAGLLCTGCATTMNKDECSTANWHMIGYENGKKGMTTERFSELQEQCSEHGIAANAHSYEAGYSSGNNEYCTAYGGLIAGENNKSYKNVCTLEQEREFLVTYNKARTHSQAKAKARRARSNLDNLIRDINYSSNKITTLKRKLDGITDREKYNSVVKKYNNEIDRNHELRQRLVFSNLELKALDAEREFNKVDYEYQIYRAEFIKQYHKDQQFSKNSE